MLLGGNGNQRGCGSLISLRTSSLCYSESLHWFAVGQNEITADKLESRRSWNHTGSRVPTCPEDSRKLVLWLLMIGVMCAIKIKITRKSKKTDGMIRLEDAVDLARCCAARDARQDQ